MQKKLKQSVYVSYEKEADVLSWELNDEPIDYAEEAGNVVVHFSKKHVPVFVEMLNAKSFLARSSRMAHAQRSRSKVRMAV